ncbi:MAG: hypothetical protein AAGJ35_15610 [Myxococcota bacterium]
MMPASAANPFRNVTHHANVASQANAQAKMPAWHSMLETGVKDDENQSVSEILDSIDHHASI